MERLLINLSTVRSKKKKLAQILQNLKGNISHPTWEFPKALAQENTWNFHKLLARGRKGFLVS